MTARVQWMPSIVQQQPSMPKKLTPPHSDKKGGLMEQNNAELQRGGHEVALGNRFTVDESPQVGMQAGSQPLRLAVYKLDQNS